MLAVGTWILLVTASMLSVLYLAIVTFHRKRREGEPEVVAGSLIWGSANDFNTHAVDFLHRCNKKYGNVFTIRLINQYLTIIMDPHSYEAMSKERNFDFDPIQKQVNHNVFSFGLREAKQMVKETGKTVRGNQLAGALTSFVKNMKISCERIHPQWQISASSNNNVIDEGSIHDWSSMGLRVFASRTIFDAIFNTVFGRDDASIFNSSLVYDNFEVFHKYFNYFWLGVPKKLFPPAMRALEKLFLMPGSEDLESRPDLSNYIRTAMAYMKEQGQTETDMKAHNLVYLHVNYNTFRLAFWALSNILEDQKALAALRQEVEQAIDEKLDEEENLAKFTMKDVEDMPILDSIVQETMRLASGVFMVRYINEDTEFTTTDGKTNLMRKGDRVAIYPPAIHKDPEIFENPEEFVYDRFVDATFYKNGRELKHPIMAFGSLCPGKRYAIIQLKWYIANIVSKFDLELQAGEHAKYAYEYHGHEVLPPIKDVKVDFRVRKNRPRLDMEL